MFQVVPFTPASGLLEWVEETMPLNDYLIGKDRESGAHARYKRPGDYEFVSCHRAMAKTAGTALAEQRAAWDEVMIRMFER
jgi:ataxia telangiectasia mutated family protein